MGFIINYNMQNNYLQAGLLNRSFDVIKTFTVIGASASLFSLLNEIRKDTINGKYRHTQKRLDEAEELRKRAELEAYNSKIELETLKMKIQTLEENLKISNKPEFIQKEELKELVSNNFTTETNLTSTKIEYLKNNFSLNSNQNLGSSEGINSFSWENMKLFLNNANTADTGNNLIPITNKENAEVLSTNGSDSLYLLSQYAYATVSLLLVIGLCLITIGIYFLNNYFIEQYNLEIKFPRIIKFVKYYRYLSYYSVIFNGLLIVVSYMSLLILSIFILIDLQ